MPEHGTRTVNEQHPQVRVSVLADPAESSAQPARGLSGSEAEVAREVSSRRETLDVTDEGEQSRGGEKADAWHGAKASGGGDLDGLGVELLLDGAYASLGSRISSAAWVSAGRRASG